jgi:RimJ/RimL family protein N-acetyltransferase
MSTSSKVILRAKKVADARDDYTWQTDQELARLDAAPLLTVSFPRYLSDYLGELRYPSLTRRCFAIETLDGKHIGNCSYYSISEAKGEAELGIMVGDRSYWDKGYGADAVSVLLNYIFRHTSLKRIHLKTLDSNTRAQKCFQKCGFTSCGHLNKDGYSFVVMEIHRKQWAAGEVGGGQAEGDA